MNKVYSVYDSKVGAYLRPFHARSDGEAMRMFQQAATDVDGPFFQHAGDYTLFGIADYEEEHGNYIPYVAKLNLGTALEYQSDPRQTVAEAIAEIPVDDEKENN